MRNRRRMAKEATEVEGVADIMGEGLGGNGRGVEK
jgi:hypothetical protein